MLFLSFIPQLNRAVKTQFEDTPENLHNINRRSHSSSFYVVHVHCLTSSAFRLLYYYYYDYDYYYYYYCYYYWKPDLEILTLNRVTVTVLLRDLEVRFVRCVLAPFHPWKR